MRFYAPTASFIGRGMLVAALVLLALAGVSQQRAQQLQVRADERGARSQAASLRFAETLNGAEQDAELRFLDERRALLVQASGWRQSVVFALAGAGLALFGAWVARELRVIGRPAPQAPADRAPAGTRRR